MRRGHPIAGAISGFFFFLFLGTTLLLLGALPLNSPWLTVLPFVGLVLGAVWGWWAPLGRRTTDAQMTMDHPPASETSASAFAPISVPPAAEPPRPITVDGPLPPPPSSGA